MRKIASFTIDHLKLLPGIYVSRKDYLNGCILTTFDLRFTRPNYEPVMSTGCIHALEHLCATYLRNMEESKNKIIYFGPMGCRTGFYLIMDGDYESRDIVGVIKDLINFIINFKGDIPGTSPKECGNYLDMDLDLGIYYAKKFKTEVLDNLSNENLEY